MRDNADEVLKKLDKTSGDIMAGVMAGVEALCAKVRNDARRFAPVVTGRLRNSIDISVASDGGDIVGTVGSNVEYAAYVELGTHRPGGKVRRAKPYLYPALKLNEGRAAGCIANGINNAIREAADD